MKRHNWFLILTYATIACQFDARFADPEGEHNGQSEGSAHATSGATSDGASSQGGAGSTSGASVTSVGGAGGRDAQPAIDASCGERMEACWQRSESCSDAPSYYCEELEETCRIMELSCLGLREVCSTWFVYEDVSPQELDAQCSALVGINERIDGVYIGHDDGATYSCCWVEPLQGPEMGAAGAADL